MRGLEHVLGIDRGLHIAGQRALKRAGKLRPVGAVDQDRLADQRVIESTGTVLVRFADAFRKGGGNAAGEERSDIQLLPRLEVGPNHDRDLGVELHG
jgi:hypothetical protein